ncbi:hypothetical protein [Sporomusa aerivorans]|uniref:hypothetical protein n=1 Tax=Sporomusa aerivorans TaxID=204936 RepID=UPI00352AA7AD
MNTIDRLLREEEKIQQKLKRVREEREAAEQKIISKMPAILKEKYPDIYNEIRAIVIEKMTSKKRTSNNDATES